MPTVLNGEEMLPEFVSEPVLVSTYHEAAAAKPDGQDGGDGGLGSGLGATEQFCASGEPFSASAIC